MTLKPTEHIQPPAGGEPYLLTPGPLTTAASVKQAMQRDWGSWDGDFRAMTAQLRAELLDILEDKHNEFECVPMQGSGTFVVEAMLGTLLPANSKSLVLINGTYGQRLVKTLKRIGKNCVAIDKGDYLPPRGDEVAQALQQDPEISHVIVVHCETSSGILNPIDEIAKVVHAAGKSLFIDSMSAFGALPITAQGIRFDALVSSANKCIEGVPGFGFILVRRNVLAAAKDCCHSLSLDLYDQWQIMESSGQWRFTPPTHVVAAFLEALHLHKQAGGAKARLARYSKNRDTLVGGMRELGFKTLLEGNWLSPIIVTFVNPSDLAFDFTAFYEHMKAKGFIIYPGKLTVVDSFRIGCIGQMDDKIMQQVVAAVKTSMTELGIDCGEAALP